MLIASTWESATPICMDYTKKEINNKNNSQGN